jgi:hypothetical protein
MIKRVENTGRDQYGYFSVSVSGGMIKDSDYIIKIFALEDGRSKLLSQKRIRLTMQK